MNEIKKFQISLLIFSIIFPLILWFKTSKIIAVSLFSILFLISLISFLNKNFSLFLKAKLKATADFIGCYLAIMTLFFIFILAILPTKFISKLFKRDRLKLKNNNAESYWINVENKENNWDLQY